MADRALEQARQQAEEALARAEAATMGPWKWSPCLWPNTRLSALKSETARYEEYPGVPVGVLRCFDYIAPEDAILIEHSREDVENLARSLLAVLARLEKAEEALAAWHTPDEWCEANECSACEALALLRGQP